MNWFQRFMQGRYGSDQLNLALVTLSMILVVISFFVPLLILNIIAWVPLIWSFVRMFSKNISARQRENYAFLRFWNGFKGIFTGARTRAKESGSYRFYKCPSCHQRVRVPRGAGKISITCPRCGTKFVKKA